VIELAQELLLQRQQQTGNASAMDGRGRKRFVVEPPFNNAHLNNHAFSPLLFIAQRANMDIKFLQDKPGIVEYVGDYASK
jgi:hypothetical protein